MLFKDRRSAGQELARKLEKYKGQKTVILALPRGGVITGAEVAKKLAAPLDLIIARKIGHPNIPEYAVGAISENGQLVANEKEIALVDGSWFKKEAERQLLEARRRRKRYFGHQKPLSLKGKIAILVDDGLATGLTMKAAIKEVKGQKPKKIVVAVPVAPKDIAEAIQKEVNEFVAVQIPEVFLGAVGSYYQSFSQLTDEDVIKEIKSLKGKLETTIVLDI